MPIIIVHLEGPLAGREQQFDDSVDLILFGRDADCQVVYPPETRTVGGRHFALRRVRAGDYVVDLFGLGRVVEIDGIRADDGTPVKSGSAIRLGGLSGPCFTVEIARNLSKSVQVEAEPELDAAAESAGSPPPSEMAEIAFHSGEAGSLDDPAPSPEDRLVDLLLMRKWESPGFIAGVAGPGEREIRFGEEVATSVPRLDPLPSDTAPSSSHRQGSSFPGAIWWIAAALAGAAAAYFLLRREIVLGAAFAKLLHAVTPPGPVPVAARAELVDASVFGPTAVPAGEEGLIQVFLHRLGQRDVARALAMEVDPDATPRGLQTLAAEIERGQQVDVILDGRGLGVDQERQTLIWRGEPCACQFVVTAPAESPGRSFHPRVIVLVDSVPVGSITFTLKTKRDETTPPKTALLGDRAKRYAYAFLSYASPDRAEVIKRAQGLKAGGTDFFNDLLALEPGERWEKRLYQEIDRCDVFYLFWSSKAKDSEWVMKETNYALARRAGSGDGDPDIVPVIIEGPPPPAPPESLKDIHFNDSLLYVLAGIGAAPP